MISMDAIEGSGHRADFYSEARILQLLDRIVLSGEDPELICAELGLPVKVILTECQRIIDARLDRLKDRPRAFIIVEHAEDCELSVHGCNSDYHRITVTVASSIRLSGDQIQKALRIVFGDYKNAVGFVDHVQDRSNRD
jgi:hypothetical protein